MNTETGPEVADVGPASIALPLVPAPVGPTGNATPPASPDAAPNPQEGDPAVYASLPIIVMQAPDADARKALDAVSRFPFKTLPLNITRIQQFDKDCVDAGVIYGLGAKVPHHGAQPGRDFSRVDCSGFVREAIWRATTPHWDIPDGSVVQHEWANNQGFKHSTPEAGALSDGAVRIAFLNPIHSADGIGHVVLLYGGRTYESYGHHGPGSRAWNLQGW